MSAALAGFLFLVIICALGLWIIKGGRSGVKDGYEAFQNEGDISAAHKSATDSKGEMKQEMAEKAEKAEEPTTTDIASTPLTQEQNLLLNKSGDLIKMVGEIAQKTYGPVKEQFEGFEQGQAAYKPLQQIIKPHQTPEQPLPAMTASAPTDRGSGAENILADEKKLASIREMIRDETASAVRDELSKSRLFNEYQINYGSV